MRKNIIAILIMVMCLSLCACGKKTLEDLFAGDTTSLDQIAASLDVNGNASVGVVDNTLVFSYDLSGNEDLTEKKAMSNKMKKELESVLEESSETYSAMCSNLEDEIGIDGITLHVNYYYGETLIVSGDFKAD